MEQINPIQPTPVIVPPDPLAFLGEDAMLNDSLLEEIYDKYSMEIEEMKVEYLAIAQMADKKFGADQLLLDMRKKLEAKKRLLDFLRSVL